MLATTDLIREAAQPARLAEALPRYLREVPRYQAFAPLAAEVNPAKVSDLLQRLPFMVKRDIRDGFPANFLGTDQDLEGLIESEAVELEHTSGTSEGRTPLLLPRGWWAEQERRALALNAQAAGVVEADPNARRVTINSPMCSNDICYTGVPSHEDRIIGNSLFVSLSRYPFLWSQSELERMAAEAVAWAPRFLDVDPVYGVVFARYCEQRGIKLPSVEFIVCSYEYVSVVHRRILRRVFGVPVYDLYGSTETGHLLIEEEQGEMRPSLETAWLEVLEPEVTGPGELVVTTLTNPIMPLIRYRIGDLVERRERPYGTRYVLHGRAADAFVRSNRRQVTTRQIDHCFNDISGICHYQLIEKSEADWRLRLVPEGASPGEAALRKLTGRLGDLLELKTDLSLQSTDMLVPEGSGKFRLGYPKGQP